MLGFIIIPEDTKMIKITKKQQQKKPHNLCVQRASILVMETEHK